MFTNALPSELAAVVATVDPDAYGVGSNSSDWVDMADFEHIMAVISVGTMGTTATINAKLEQATTSGGTPKDITGKAITQLTQASPDDSDKQAIINLRGSELDLDNGYRWVRLTITGSDTASPPVASVDYSGIIVGMSPRHGPASDNDLASVAEIVN